MGARVALLLVLLAGSSARADETKPDAGMPAPPPDARRPPPSDTVAVHPPVPPPVVEDHFTWEPFGYLRMQYRVVQNDPNVAFIGRDDGFELQNARIGVRGHLER